MKHAILATGVIIHAVTSIPSHADETAELRETSRRVFERELPSVSGKSLIAVEVLYPPGTETPSHTHPGSVFIYAYVLSGEVLSAVDDEKPRLYRAGESWYEVPGAHHRVSRNASKTEPAKLLAIFVLDSNERQVMFSDAN